MRDYLHRLRQSVVVYPSTGIWLAGSTALIAMAAGKLRLDIGLVLLALLTVLLIQLGMRREVRKVHVLVNSQRDLLLSRIDQLIAALRTAGVDVPKAKDDTP